jgi:hypothetical protein
MFLFRKEYEEDFEENESFDEEIEVESEFQENNQTSTNTVNNSSNVTESNLSKANNTKIEDERINMMMACVFVSIVWSIGANLKQHSRELFSTFFTELIDNSLTKYPKYFNLFKILFIFHFISITT